MGRSDRVSQTPSSIPAQIDSYSYISQTVHRDAPRPHRARMLAPADTAHPRHWRGRRARTSIHTAGPAHTHAHRSARLLRYIPAVRRAVPRHGRERRSRASLRCRLRRLPPRYHRTERNGVEGRFQTGGVRGIVSAGGKDDGRDLEL